MGKMSEIKIVTDEQKMRVPCENATQEEADKIYPLLAQKLEELEKAGTPGYGLAANQIGFNKKVALINYGGKTIKLLNPRIVAKINPTIFNGEGCFSVPNVRKNTLRYEEIVFENEENGEVRTYHATQSDGFLPVIVHHEIDHMEGRLFIDHKQLPVRIKKEEKIGRNEPCPCGEGQPHKFKKCPRRKLV